MSINRKITEQELQDIFNAIRSIELAEGKTETGAHTLANDITYAVFRNVIEPESIYRWVVVHMCKVFSVPVQKGQGRYQ